jgi:hypothetical protein
MGPPRQLGKAFAPYVGLKSTRESLGTSIARPGLTRRSNDILEKLSAWRRLPAGAASSRPVRWIGIISSRSILGGLHH